MAQTLSMDRSQPRPLVLSIGYFVGFVALGLAYAALGPTLADLAANVGTDLTRISYVLSARGLGYLVGSLVGGRLYDRRWGNPLMAGALLCAAVVMVAVPTIPVLWLLVSVVFVLGFFLGVVDLGGNTLLVWLHGEGVDPYMNALHFFFGIGAFLSPVVIAQAVSRTGDITPGYWVLAALLVPVAVWLGRLPSPQAAPEREEHVDGTPEGRAGLVVLIAVFFFLYVGAEAGFGGWIATYARTTGVGDAVTAAYLTSAFWGAMTVGRLLAVPISARYAPRYVLAADLVGALVSVVVLAIWPGNPAATWIGTIGAGLSIASLFPTALSLAEKRMRITGSVNSAFFVGASLGGMSIPWLIGQLLGNAGPRVMALVIAGAVLADIVVLVLILAWGQPAREVTDG